MQKRTAESAHRPPAPQDPFPPVTLLSSGAPQACSDWRSGHPAPVAFHPPPPFPSLLPFLIFRKRKREREAEGQKGRGPRRGSAP